MLKIINSEQILGRKLAETGKWEENKIEEEKREETKKKKKEKKNRECMRKREKKEKKSLNVDQVPSRDLIKVKGR